VSSPAPLPKSTTRECKFRRRFAAVKRRGLVLIVASRSTREVDGVIDRVRENGYEVVRFSPCQYPEPKACSWRPGSGPDAFEAPDAAWLCDFSGWSVEASLTGLEREIALAEVTAFVDGIFLSLSTNWINNPVAIRSASRKVLQLETVSRLGIAVPTTCVTNDPEEARRFCDAHEAVVAKALSTGFVTYGGKALKLYTRPVDRHSDALFNALKNGPLIFQSRVAKTEEVRSVVIDGHVALVRADLDGLPNDLVDIRRLDYQAERARFSPCNDRPDLAEASREIVAALCLSYGCIDWAIESDGTAIFLECNPLGSFKWFELCGGDDITGHIAEALVLRCAR
jgi:glutathione synthase/RimK-type ligase-like ATP-grasp enzyme